MVARLKKKSACIKSRVALLQADGVFLSQANIIAKCCHAQTGITKDTKEPEAKRLYEEMGALGTDMDAVRH